MSDFSKALAELLDKAVSDGHSLEHILMCLKVNEMAIVGHVIEQTTEADG